MEEDDNASAARGDAALPSLSEADFARMMGENGQQQSVVADGPVVPFVPHRQHVDLGPGGSLLEDYHRLATSTPRRPTDRGRTAIVAGALALVTLCWVLAMITVPASLGWTIAGAIVELACLAAAVLIRLRWTGLPPAVRQLRRQAAVERRIARQLGMPSSAWTILCDRLLPGTEHRLPFLAVGPGGIILFSALPPGPYHWTETEPLSAAGGSIPYWLSARNWEVRRMIAAFQRGTVGRWPFTGPFTLMFLDLTPIRRRRLSQRIRRRPAELRRPPFAPARLGNYQVLRPEQVSAAIADMPDTLSRPVVADLLEQVTQLCPPAGEGIFPSVETTGAAADDGQQQPVEKTARDAVPDSNEQDDDQ